MGGKALASQGLETRRLNKQEYDQWQQEIQASFAKAFPNVDFKEVVAYREKPDFGDLDLLIVKEQVESLGGPEALIAWAQNEGHARAYYDNKDQISVEWRQNPEQEHGFQLDLLLMPRADFDTAFFYFAYNDLGNFKSVLARSMGLVFGHRGLLMQVVNGTHELGWITLSQDPQEMDNFLGFDHQRFKKGFDNLEQIFETVASSRYFTPEIYSLENRNHASRMRDQKRKTYQLFLTWIKEQPSLPSFDFDAIDWKKKTFEAFPHAQIQYDQWMEQEEKRQRLKNHFNSALVSEWTGLKGREIGHTMEAIRSLYSTEELDQIIQSEGLEGVRKAVLGAFNTSDTTSLTCSTNVGEGLSSSRTPKFK